MQQLADEIGVEIRVAHYPPYISKYNPIDHRLFPHLTRACHGVILYSIELLQELMAATTTTTGLRVFVSILDRAYDKGRQIAADFKETMTIRFDDFLPQWNYTAVPNHP